MGKLERERWVRAAYARTVPVRLVKAVVAAFGWPIYFPYVVARLCYAQNKWPWDGDL